MFKEFFEKYVLSNFFRQNPVNSFTDVFPAEPVIAIVLIFVDFLKAELTSLNNFNGFLQNIALGFLIFWFDIATIAPFFIASTANLFPSKFLPLIPKNIELLVIFFELIEADLRIFFYL